MFKNILLSFDGSEHAINAARISAEIALEQSHPYLWVACVVEDPPEPYQEPYKADTVASRTAKGEDLLNQASAIIDSRVEIKRELLFGDPAESIIKVAETRGCDLIVMGSRGLGKLSSLLLGSKTQKVVSLASCPVLVVK
jgi:nucleotide-binding universal stress UspA family protein